MENGNPSQFTRLSLSSTTGYSWLKGTKCLKNRSDPMSTSYTQRCRCKPRMRRNRAEFH